MRIAIDAMGGDFAPEAPVAGALRALERFSDIELVLVGDPDQLQAANAHERITLHDAPDVVRADDDPVRAIRNNPRSSARACAELLHSRHVQAVVTMGNTSAAVAAATLYCRRLPGVRRTGIAAPIPRPGGVTTLIDGGANPDSRADDLLQYAIMATHYVRAAFGIAEPRVGILSIGEERSKGNRLVAETWERFEAHPFPHFVGNVEARELFESKADVVVCDGFVGNVTLKAVEGTAEFMMNALKKLLPKHGLPDPREALHDLLLQVDYSKYGGAPLLGIDGGYLIGHGRSGPEAFENGIRAIRPYVQDGVGAAIIEELTAAGAAPDMTSTALIFPGQGAQHVGMGVDVADAYPQAADVFARAADVLGYDLLALCRDGPREALVPTDIQQPAILAVGAAVTAALQAHGALAPDALRACFGLSLGEFTALHAAGALSLEDALILVRERGLGMQEASEATPSGMLALRCEREDAEAVCAAARTATGGVCTVANLNAPGQVVISGDQASLDAAEAAANERGLRRAVRLPVAGAFHSPLMQIGADRLARTLETVEVRAPRVPVISNVTATPTQDPDAIRQNLIDQVTHPVRFMDCVRAARMLGVETVIEPAPGRVLAGLIRRIDPDITAHGAADAEGVGALCAPRESA